MLHSGLIAAHAVAGVIAFAAGSLAMYRRAAFRAYFVALTAMVLFIVAAVAVDWSKLENPSQALFGALTGLAGYLIWRASRARQLLLSSPSRIFGTEQEPSRRARYVDHIGFTLVALFEGFAIVAVLEAGGPGWLVATLGVAGLGIGHATISRLKTPARTPVVALPRR